MKLKKWLSAAILSLCVLGFSMLSPTYAEQDSQPRKSESEDMVLLTQAEWRVIQLELRESIAEVKRLDQELRRRRFTIDILEAKLELSDVKLQEAKKFKWKMIGCGMMGPSDDGVGIPLSLQCGVTFGIPF